MKPRLQLRTIVRARIYSPVFLEEWDLGCIHSAIAFTRAALDAPYLIVEELASVEHRAETFWVLLILKILKKDRQPR